MNYREIMAKDAVEKAILDMRYADTCNYGANSVEVTPFFIAYLRAKIVEADALGTYQDDVFFLKSMIAEIEALNPQMWTNGKPMEKV